MFNNFLKWFTFVYFSCAAGIVYTDVILYGTFGYNIIICYALHFLFNFKIEGHLKLLNTTTNATLNDCPRRRMYMTSKALIYPIARKPSKSYRVSSKSVGTNHKSFKAMDEQRMEEDF